MAALSFAGANKVSKSVGFAKGFVNDVEVLQDLVAIPTEKPSLIRSLMALPQRRVVWKIAVRDVSLWGSSAHETDRYFVSLIAEQSGTLPADRDPRVAAPGVAGADPSSCRSEHQLCRD